MKIKFTLTTILISILFISCSSNNDESIDISDNIPSTYLPLTTNNFWNYDVSSTYNGNVTLSKDSLHVGNDISLNSLTYKKMFSEGMDPVGNSTGFYSSILNNNGLRIDGSRLRLSGTVNLPTIISDPITLNLNDFIIFKENAPSGTELNSVSGSFIQTIQTYPLTFNYTFKSVADANLNSYTSNGTTYNDIKKTKLILNLTVTYNATTSSGIPITLYVLPAQDVIVSTQYYSKNIGVVYNSTSINYSMNTSVISSLNLPSNIPTASDITQEEFLKNHHIY
jgi:hypothetical protein